MQPLPHKLKVDSIAEALCEVRFDCLESKNIPEVVVGRLADGSNWKRYQSVRLSSSEIPSHLRSQIPPLKFQPVMELRDPSNIRIVKIGSNLLSYHVMAPYPGWDQLEVEINGVIDFLFGAFENFEAVRLGFRYVNLMTDEDHEIKNISQLNYSLEIGGEHLDVPQMIIFERQNGPHHNTMIRIASPKFASGNVPKSFSALIDVDVYTPPTYVVTDSGVAKKWVKDAHDFEKAEFFDLLTQETLDLLREE